MNDAVLYERVGHIGYLTLNRPDQRNSMTPELLDAFAAATAAARAESDLRCVVVRGRGPCFSAGADFKAGVQRGGDRSPSEKSFAMYAPFLSLLDLEVPIVGALNGHTVGGGFGLSLVCDIRVGNRASKYGANFAKLGLHPGMAISYMLPRIVGPAHAAELLYTGELIDGERAATIGLLNHAVDVGDVDARADAIARAIAAAAPIAVRGMKATLRRFTAVEAREAARNEAYAQAESLLSEDAKEGMAALLEKRTPVFHGR